MTPFPLIDNGPGRPRTLATSQSPQSYTGELHTFCGKHSEQQRDERTGRGVFQRTNLLYRVKGCGKPH